MSTFFFGGIHLSHLQLKQKKYKGNSNQASFWGVGYVVFNATFSNISTISWQSVLLVEETGVPRVNH